MQNPSKYYMYCYDWNTDKNINSSTGINPVTPPPLMNSKSRLIIPTMVPCHGFSRPHLPAVLCCVAEYADWDQLFCRCKCDLWTLGSHCIEGRLQKSLLSHDPSFFACLVTVKRFNHIIIHATRRWPVPARVHKATNESKEFQQWP